MTNCINEKRLLPEEVEQPSPQAGRYMSDAEIDADRLALMEWLSDYGVLPTGYHRLYLARYKESLTRIAPENNSPK